jgi:hypothetical protein
VHPSSFGGFRLPDIRGLIAARFRRIFSDISPQESPLAHGIQDRGNSRADLLDGVIHAVAELEKRVPKPGGEDKAA